MPMPIYDNPRPARDDRKYLPMPDCYPEEKARARFVEKFGIEPEVIHHFDGYWWPGPCPAQAQEVQG